MIYDFHGNFSQIYPLKKELLKSPDRDKWGYYWDFEDYLIEEETGRGLTLQGFMISSIEDFSVFSGLFQRAFRMSTINAKIKNCIIINYMDFGSGLDFEDSYLRSSVRELDFDIDAKIESMNSLFDLIRNKLRRNARIWIPLNSYWTDLMRDETSNFWGLDVEILRLPEEYTPMNNKDLWEELDTKGPLEFNKDMMWEDFSFIWPNLVKYVDPDIVKRIDTDFLRIGSEYGLI
jgi:hypothetical protein